MIPSHQTHHSALLLFTVRTQKFDKSLEEQKQHCLRKKGKFSSQSAHSFDVGSNECVEPRLHVGSHSRAGQRQDFVFRAQIWSHFFKLVESSRCVLREKGCILCSQLLSKLFQSGEDFHFLLCVIVPRQLPHNDVPIHLHTHTHSQTGID